MERRLPIRAPLALLILATSPRALGDVHVVAPAAGPGVDFTDLQAAIDAAQSGDIVLLKAGTYAGGGALGDNFDLTGKSLTLVAEVGTNPLLSSRVFAGGQPSGAIVLRGVDVLATTLTGALVLDGDAATHVHVEDADVRAIAAFTTPTFTPAASGVFQVAGIDLVAVNCTMTGADNPGTFFVAGSGLSGHSLGSSALFGCQLAGGTGSGSGGSFQHEFLFAAGCTLTGGAGLPGKDATGPGPTQGCTSGSAGGSGMVLADPFGGALMVLLGSTLAGGPGGAAGLGQPGCASGPAGLAQWIVGAPPVVLGGTPRGFATNTPVREGQTLTLHYTGQPGEFVFVDVGGVPGFTYFPDFKGVLVVDQPLLLFQGVVPSGGVLQRSAVINDLGPGVEGTTVFLQSFHFSLDLGILAGTPSAVVLLDAAF